jgi:hypothetical protein
MPQATFVTTTAAGAGSQVFPVAGWTYEFLPWPARVKLLVHANAAGTLQVYSGSESIMDPSPVQVNATAGALPSDLNVHPIIFDAPAGDRLRLVFTTTTAGATIVSIVMLVTPLA